VHLAGKSDGDDGIRVEAGSLKGFANRERCGAPPVARILLCPAGLRAGEIGVLFGARGENGAALVEDDRTGSAGPYVDAENRNTASSYSKSCARLGLSHNFRHRIW